MLATLCGAALACLGGAGTASETVSYSYDALGRLTASTISGGPNGTIGTGTCFDAAGNRTRYIVGGGVNGCSAPPSPPPVAVADSTSGPCNSFHNYDVVANDYDPNGNTPLSLVSVTGTGNVDATIVNSTTVQFIGYAPGTDTLSYVIQNSLGGTATGTISYRTTGNQQTCFQKPDPAGN